MSNKQLKLIKKLELLLKQLNCRSYLHHFGPKKFKLVHHLIALLLMQSYKLSLRRVEKLMKMFGMKVPSYSALCKRRKAIPSWIWNKLLYLTAGLKHKTVAIDATGFSRTNPSYHFVKRIDRINPVKGFAKLSMLFDIDKNKVVSIHVRVRRAHDIKDAKRLLRRCYEDISSLLADKGYDAEKLHKYCYKRGIQTIIPKKKNIRRGFYRKKQMKKFTIEKYHRRSLIESGFSAIKRKYGGSVAGKSLAAINSEISCKALAHNLSLSA